MFGFALISFGVYEVIQNPSELGAPKVTSSSCIIINLIERINAVGISVQILDTMSNISAELNDKVTSHKIYLSCIVQWLRELTNNCRSSQANWDNSI